MIDRILNSKNVIHRALKASEIRNEIITENIANVTTPGYKRKYVSFETELGNAMQDPKFKKADANKVDIKVLEDNKTSYRKDGNNVDIDVEMAELAKNTIKYNALIQMSSYKKIMMILKNTR